MKKLTIILLIVLLAGCSSREQDQTHQTKRSRQDALLHSLPYPINVNKHCPNKQCASYTLLIDRAGILSINVNNASEPTKSQLVPLEIKQIKQLLEALKLTKLNTQIIPGHFECAYHVSDQANYQMVFEKGDFPQRLQINQGCKKLPQRYQSFLDWFDYRLEKPLNN